jgi:hypothetical protein
MITGKENIENFRLLTLRSALRLEVRGMKRRGRSAYAIVKEEFGLKGNKQKVLDALNKIIHEKLGM